ncbi:MAG: DUF1579 domain-containing protein [Puia sp.]|nr:DUF1579 domain-containing protein [Puia sp.]
MERTLRLLPVLLSLCYCVSAQNEQEMRAMMTYMNPGVMHKVLENAVGVWTGKGTIWTQPGGSPVSMATETTNEMILGGRYLQGKNSGSFMGMLFEGIGTTAYDNAKKLFLYTWIDNMGTGMLYLEGTWDDANKTIYYTGKIVDPVSGKDIPVREKMVFVDPNTEQMEMYTTVNGQEYKNMEVTYTRK